MLPVTTGAGASALALSALASGSVLEEPRKPPNAYWLFANERRESLAQQAPVGAGAAALARLAGSAWRSLPTEEREAFEAQAASLRTAYEASLERFRLHGGIPLKRKIAAARRGAPAPGAVCGSVLAGSGSKRRKKQAREAEEPGRPSRPRNAYWLFLADHRERFARSLPPGSGGAPAVARVAAEAWKALAAAEREPYERKAAELQEAYAVNLKAYLAERARAKEAAAAEAAQAGAEKAELPEAPETHAETAAPEAERAGAGAGSEEAGQDLDAEVDPEAPGPEDEMEMEAVAPAPADGAEMEAEAPASVDETEMEAEAPASAEDAEMEADLAGAPDMSTEVETKTFSSPRGNAAESSPRTDDAKPPASSPKVEAEPPAEGDTASTPASAPSMDDAEKAELPAASDATEHAETAAPAAAGVGAGAGSEETGQDLDAEIEPEAPAPADCAELEAEAPAPADGVQTEVEAPAPADGAEMEAEAPASAEDAEMEADLAGAPDMSTEVETKTFSSPRGNAAESSPRTDDAKPPASSPKVEAEPPAEGDTASTPASAPSMDDAEKAELPAASDATEHAETAAPAAAGVGAGAGSEETGQDLDAEIEPEAPAPADCAELEAEAPAPAEEAEMDADLAGAPEMSTEVDAEAFSSPVGNATEISPRTGKAGLPTLSPEVEAEPPAKGEMASTPASALEMAPREQLSCDERRTTQDAMASKQMSPATLAASATSAQRPAVLASEDEKVSDEKEVRMLRVLRENARLRRRLREQRRTIQDLLQIVGRSTAQAGAGDSGSSEDEAALDDGAPSASASAAAAAYVRRAAAHARTEPTRQNEPRHEAIHASSRGGGRRDSLPEPCRAAGA
eukprot:TRINITY_DN2039_c0_g1_i2.p1 TRINITY_DN2039_c0_g1~~TRINITY_DN2039_c0_g1_i2.p1  ORF type:complete len:889 (+),score=276.18 TRINITY_DN2039_c0_g1_i2:97-2667(+)